jgi:hypothetical protein
MKIREGLNEIRLRIIAPMNTFWKRFQKVCVGMALAIPTAQILDSYFDILPKTITFQTIKAFTLGMLIMGTIIPYLTTKEPIKLDKVKNDEAVAEDNLSK